MFPNIFDTYCYACFQDLQAKLDEATKGIIYFSLGAIQESEQLSQYMLQTLTDAFKELPFTVLWKIANTTMINKPDNVITSAWFPQQQVLGEISYIFCDSVFLSFKHNLICLCRYNDNAICVESRGVSVF